MNSIKIIWSLKYDIPFCVIFYLPTFVDPVNDIAATFVLLHNAFPTEDALSLEDVTTLMTPYKLH